MTDEPKNTENMPEDDAPRRPAPAPAPEVKPVARRPRALSGSVVNAASRGAKPPPPPPPKEPPAPPPPGGDDPTPPPKKPSDEALALEKQRRARRAFAILFPVCALLLVISLVQIITTQQEYRRAQEEYDELAQQAFPDSGSSTPEVEILPTVDVEMQLPEEERPMTLTEVMGRNEDCVAWIEIPDTPLNYPLVQGPDNDRYLNRTFLGNVNSAGAIFLDYRNEKDMSSPHSIIYGHNMKNGTMFGGLNNYLENSGYMNTHPTIYVHNGTQRLQYRVVNARITDKWDDAYRVDFDTAAELDAFAQTYGAPAGTERMLTLSTCTNGAKEERVVVHAVYEGIAG